MGSAIPEHSLREANELYVLTVLSRDPGWVMVRHPAMESQRKERAEGLPGEEKRSLQRDWRFLPSQAEDEPAQGVGFLSATPLSKLHPERTTSAAYEPWVEEEFRKMRELPPIHDH
jgi:hypothetical protein